MATTTGYYTSPYDTLAFGSPCGGSAVVGLPSITSEVDPDGYGSQARLSRVTVYDSLGRPKGTQVSGSPWACTTYDARGRTTQQTYPAYGVAAARSVPTSWSPDMLTTTTSDSAGTVTSTTDLVGRVVSSTDTWNKTTTTSYDLAGRPTTTTGPNGALTTANRVDGLIQTVSLDGSVVATPNWSASAELDAVAYPNGVTGTFARDPLGNDATVSWAGPGGSITTDAVTRNQAAKIIDQTIDGADPNPAGANYTYDQAGRLTDAWTPGHHQTYGFGAASCGSQRAGKNTNRTAATDNAAPGVSYCYDSADKLTQVNGDARYSGAINYDNHGNTTTLGNTTLGYDNADRHLRTTTGSTTVDYTRDASDRITRRSVNGTVVAEYAHCGTGDNPCATLDTAGNVLERIIGLPGGATLTRTATGDTWALSNIHGDTVALTNSSGVKQGATRTYDPFGQNTAGGTPDTLTGNLDYGWLGENQRPQEHEAGLDTIEMGARQYIPGLGRFTELDPIEGGSANDYEYVSGDPINKLDLDGHGQRGRRNIKHTDHAGVPDSVLKGQLKDKHTSKAEKEKIRQTLKDRGQVNKQKRGHSRFSGIRRGMRRLFGNPYFSGPQNVMRSALPAMTFSLLLFLLLILVFA